VSDVSGLLRDLDDARTAFHRAATEVEAAGLAESKVVEGWNLRDLTAHVAFWCEHGAEALDLARAGRGNEFDYDQRRTDAMNADVTERGRAMDLSAARDWEERAFAALRARLADVPDALLETRLGNGDTVEDVARYDGPDHYAEHAAHLRNAVIRGH
jgi:hypothetical protein